MCSVMWTVVLLGVAIVANASLVGTDFARQLKLLTPRSIPLTGIHSGGIPQRVFAHEAVSGRRLMQQNVDTCAWDLAADECLLSAGTVLDLLEQVDNPLSTYLQRAITCAQAEDRNECRQSNCEWHLSYCDVSMEDFREFTSVQCLEEVEHIIDLQAGAIECIPIRDRQQCDRNARCAWDPNQGICFFDEWLYFHDIPQVRGLPEGYSDVENALANQLLSVLNIAIDNGEIVTAEDALSIELSEFICPSDFQVLCDFVQASTPIFATGTYCSHAYPTYLEQYGCGADPLCRPDFENDYACVPSDSVVAGARLDAYLGFAQAIDDPEASRYVHQAAECASHLQPDTCEMPCIWLDHLEVCSIATRWAEDEVYNLVGEADNVVCQFYVSDIVTGCVDNTNEETCRADRQCVWLPDFGSCVSGLYAWLDIAFAGSDVEDRFTAGEDTCSGMSRSECSEVVSTEFNIEVSADGSLESITELEIDFDESSHTALSQSIGERAIFGVVF